MKKKYIKNGFLLVAGGLLSTFGMAQTYSFTTCDSTGRFGPSQAAVNAEYTATNLDGDVTINTEGIQEWNAPFTGIYRISAHGAQGGENSNYVYGLGATISGEFSLNAGENISILVGQKPDMSAQYAKGGGGGSFVWQTNNSMLLIAAGGGGGASNATVDQDSIIDGRISEDGGFHTNQVTNGEGGAAIDWNWSGGAGAGWNSNGDSVPFTHQYAGGGGLRPLEGGIGGDFVDGSYTGNPYGGFGGGGGSGVHVAGAGGGYTGGEGGGYENNNEISPGGGGSFNGGSNKLDTAGNHMGDGLVVFELICSVDLGVSVSGATLTSNDVSGTASFQWVNCSNMSVLGINNSYTATANGDYAVIVTNGLCEYTSDCFTISSIVDTSDCGFSLSTTKSGTTITAVDTSSDLSFQWINCSNTASINGATNRSFTATSNGSYAVVITDGNNCSDTSNCVSVTMPNGISENVDTYSVYPNPSNGIFNVDLPLNSDVSIRVLNISGQEIYSASNVNSNTHSFELNNEAGIYFLEIETGNNKEYFKLIKK